MAQVELRNIRKSFDGAEVIRGVDLEIEAGEFVALVGPSGCGKSTLLRLLAGLEDADDGDIYMDGECVNDRTPAARGIAMVFQSYALYPHMTARQNMAFGLRRGDAKTAAQKVERAAEILNLDGLLARKPAQLSGGQRQRVAIGRAIVREPRIFLFDEPLSNLDASLRARTRVEIARLHRRLSAAMVYVTHDQVEAMTLADRIAVLSRGKVEQTGAPLDLYDNPANLFVASFLGSPQMNILPCESAGGRRARLSGGAIVETSRRLAEGAPAHIGIRPEHISLSDSDSGGVAGAVALAERLGSDTFLHIDLENEATVVARADARCPLQAGDNVRLLADSAHLHFFSKDGRALTGGD